MSHALTYEMKTLLNMVALETQPISIPNRQTITTPKSSPTSLCPLESPKIRRSNSFTRRRPGPKSILKKSDLKAKKSLTFASSIEMICHFIKTESPRTVSFVDPLYIQDSGDTSVTSVSSSLLIPKHWSIRSQSENQFVDRPFVMLDQVDLHENRLRIGVLVRNLAFEKQVTIRYTLDGWKTYMDIDAVYQSTVGVSYDQYVGVDRFVCEMDISKWKGSFVQMDLAIRYRTLNQEHWDNNNCKNYQICFEKKVPIQKEKAWERDSLDSLDYLTDRDCYTTIAPLDTRLRHRSLVTNFNGPLTLKPFRDSILTRSFH